MTTTTKVATINTKNIMVLLVNSGIKNDYLKEFTNKMKPLGKEGEFIGYACTHEQREAMMREPHLNPVRNRINFYDPQLFAGTVIGKHFDVARRVVAIPEKPLNRSVKFTSKTL